MDGCYAEGIVKRRMTIGAILGMVGMIALMTAGLFFAMVNPWGVALLVIAALLIFIFYKYLRVEYEYIFVTGEFQVDRIYSGAVRKKGPRVDMSSVESVGPVEEERISRADRKTVLDFSSHQKDALVYEIVFRDNNGQKFLLFEPNEKLLRTMWRYSPSKVRLPEGFDRYEKTETSTQ